MTNATDVHDPSTFPAALEQLLGTDFCWLDGQPPVGGSCIICKKANSLRMSPACGFRQCIREYGGVSSTERSTMPSVERTVTVLQPIEKVWAYLSDFRTSQEWDPPSVSTTRTSGDGGVGTTYHNVSKFAGHATEVDYIVTEFIEHERFQLKGDAGSIQLLDTLTFSSMGEVTLVTYHAEFEPTGAAKLAEPLMPAALALLANKVAGSLEEHLVDL